MPTGSGSPSLPNAMTPDTAATTPVTPQPGLVKTIGILNLLTGGFILLCGAGWVLALVQYLLPNSPLRLDPANAQVAVEEMRRTMVGELANLERSATSEADRERLRKERADLEARSFRLESQVDFRVVNGELPWLSRYLWADALSGPVVNLLWLGSGVGLVLCRGWGRTLALWTAWIKVARLLLLNGLLALVVIPHLCRAADQFARSEAGDAVVSYAMSQQGLGRGGAGAPTEPKLTPADVVQIMQRMGYGYAATFLCLGAIYPVVVLIVLSRPSARAACAPPAARADGPTQ
jgi:hypothetical protein